MKILTAALLTLGMLFGLTASATEGTNPAILVVSFGTSHADTRAQTLDAIEADIAAAFEGHPVRRAFTSQTIIDILRTRDGMEVDTVQEALKRLKDDGITSVIVQPTLVMNGHEYDEIVRDIAPFAEDFDTLALGKPLLTDVDDYFAVIDAMSAEFPEVKDTDALVLMGHGTHHYANATYAAMDYMFKDAGHPNVFVGTVEGYPELDTVMKRLEAFEPGEVTLLPMMIVAGDHAKNDMAGDADDSWKRVLEDGGYTVHAVLKGLGEYEGIRALFTDHVRDAMDGAAPQG